MSAVQTLRDIPVIVEHTRDLPMDIDYDTGFPFDRDFERNRSGSFRSKLDDIAKRHPEFAEHLQGIPRRSSLSRAEVPEEYIRRFDRPFGSGFERFGFPFDDEFERGEPHRTHHQEYHNSEPSNQQPQQEKQYGQHPPQQPPQYYHQEPEQSSASSCSGTQTNQSEESQPQEQTRGRARNIQQSNTADLSQKQEEALNERNQRSMSAPPSENRQGQRFVSSINIPVNREAGSGDNPAMGKQYSTQPQGGSKSQGTTERVIPIHVEGRDDPVLPKNHPQNFGHTTQQAPQSERIFGQRPEQFTQFVREPRTGAFSTDWGHPTAFERHGFPEEEFVRRQHVPPQHQQFQQRTSSPQRQPQRPATPQQHQSHQTHAPPQAAPAKSETPPSQPQVTKAKQPLTPVEQIQAIQQDVSDLLKQVEEFQGAPKDKQYLYLDEMLTRNLLKLDNIDTQGQDSIRSARKEAIKCIERGIGALEAKAAFNVAVKEEKMEVQSQEQGKSEEVKEEKMEAREEKAPEQQPMEVAVETGKVQDTQMENIENEKGDSKKSEDENMAVEENVVSVKDAIAKIEENKQKAEENKQNVEDNNEKVSDIKPSSDNTEENIQENTTAVITDESNKTDEVNETAEQKKPEEKKEKKKIKKKVAADKDKK